MSPAHLILTLVLAYLSVFLQTGLDTPRLWLGGPLSFLPALLVYVALRLDLLTVTLFSLCGGLWLDSVSANPLGTSILPLFVTSWLLWRRRELLLREVDYAQIILGAGASLLVPLLSLLVLLTKGLHPNLGWQTLWQLAILTVSGGILTPILFRLLDLLERLFLHPVVKATPFRADRQIQRGRH